MSSSSSQDPDPDTAIKTRIITHMNTSHQDSLIRYLRSTHHLSSFRARHAHLQSLSLSSLTISLSPPSSSSKTYLIPIDPPLTSFAEARTRLAEMDATACTALDVSPITLKRYIPPRGIHLILFIYLLLVLLIFPRRANFQPPSNIHHYLSQVPYGARFARFCWKAQPWVMGLLLGIHSVEVWWMEKTRLRRYNVPRGGRLWWLWVASTSVEGYGAFQRLDGEVKWEGEKREKQRH
ncbi:MAG: hypothetical protein Q9176_006766 [Flavoplaca citrina]